MRTQLILLALLSPVVGVPATLADEPASAPASGEDGAWGPARDGLAIGARTDSRRYGNGKIVKLTVTIKNLDQREREIPVSPRLHMYRVEAVRKGGKPVPLTPRGRSEWLRDSSSLTATLKGGSGVSTEFELNQLFDLSLPGDYAIRVFRKVWKRGDPTKTQFVELTSNELVITIDEDAQRDNGAERVGGGKGDRR